MASIRTHTLSDGRAVYAVLWRDPDTKRQTSYRLDSRGEAENFKRLIEANAGHLAPTESILDAIARKVPTLTDVVEEYVSQQATITERTRADYRRDAANHIAAQMGWRPVDQVTTAHVHDWLRTLGAAGLSDKSIANVRGLLSSAMSFACKMKYRADNPCSGIRKYRLNEHQQEEMVFLSREEWAVLDGELGQVLDGHHQLLFRTLAGTGLRWGEVVALQVGDLDLNPDTPSLRVSKAQRRDENSKAYVGPTKTRMSRRTVSLPASLAEQLREHVKGKRRDALVFTSRLGNPVHHSNVRSFVWLPATAAAMDVARHGAAALPRRPRVHDLRHSHASWLIAAGVDLFAVQRRLGHEEVTTTTKVYGHLLPEQQRSAAAAADAILLGL
jgi:integrase